MKSDTSPMIRIPVTDQPSGNFIRRSSISGVLFKRMFRGGFAISSLCDGSIKCCLNIEHVEIEIYFVVVVVQSDLAESSIQIEPSLVTGSKGGSSNRICLIFLPLGSFWTSSASGILTPVKEG